MSPQQATAIAVQHSPAALSIVFIKHLRIVACRVTDSMRFRSSVSGNLHGDGVAADPGAHVRFRTGKDYRT
jgi:hypothetical protein